MALDWGYLDARAARAWVSTLRGRAPDPGAAGAAQALGLASPSEPDPLSGLGTWDYLLQPEGGGLADAEMRARVLHEMGGDGSPPPEAAWPRRDVSAIRAQLGI